MIIASNIGVQSFAVVTESVLYSISQMRPDLDLASILEWANAQALKSPDHDTLHYLDVANRILTRGESLQKFSSP